jgi:hypothetical protein
VAHSPYPNIRTTLYQMPSLYPSCSLIHHAPTSLSPSAADPSSAHPFCAPASEVHHRPASPRPLSLSPPMSLVRGWRCPGHAQALPRPRPPPLYLNASTYPHLYISITLFYEPYDSLHLLPPRLPPICREGQWGRSNHTYHTSSDQEGLAEIRL